VFISGDPVNNHSFIERSAGSPSKAPRRPAQLLRTHPQLRILRDYRLSDGFGGRRLAGDKWFGLVQRPLCGTYGDEGPRLGDKGRWLL